MEKNPLKAELRQLIANNRVKKVFKLLTQNLDKNTDVYKDFLLLSMRFNAVEDERMAGLISYSQAASMKNVIASALLEYLDRLVDADFKNQTTKLPEQIDKSILVIPNPKNGAAFFEEFSRQFNFENMDILLDIDQDFGKRYDLVIFDNRDLVSSFSLDSFKKLPASAQESINTRIALMEKIMKETTMFLIHFGGGLHWINSNRERVQAANSKFSLYARTKEMIDFMAAYRI